MIKESYYYYCWSLCCADAYSDKHIVYKWKEGPRKSVGINLDMQPAQFIVRGYRAKNKLEILSTGRTLLTVSSAIRRHNGCCNSIW